MFAKTLDVDVWGQGRHINDLKNSSKFKTYALWKKKNPFIDPKCTS